MSDADKANFLGHYANLIDGWIFRWKRAVAEARTGTYSADRMAEDVMASYADGVEYWAYPWGVIAERLQPPIVTIEIGSAEIAAVQSEAIADPGPGNPTIKDLTPKQSGGGTILAGTHYTAALASDRRSVILSLKSLDTLSPRLKKGDRYEGDVLFGLKDDVIARVVVIVKD